MIKVINKQLQLVSGIGRRVNEYCCGNWIQENKKKSLAQILEKVSVRGKPSIFLEEEESKRKRVLSSQDKKLLGLYIPTPTFNNRMTKKDEIKYRAQICEQLYDEQGEKLEAQVKIIQMQEMREKKELSVDEYVNMVYKDIFGRYLISKGIGIQWNAGRSQYGVLGSQYKPKLHNFNEWLLDMIRHYGIDRKETLGLFSYSQNKFVSMRDAEIQTISKIGHFFTLKLTQFDKFEDQFQVLRDRQSEVKVMAFSEDLLKMINPHALCVERGRKMIMLKNMDKEDYLITSMDIYSQFKSYFKNNKYEKQHIFNSDHLVGMKCNGLPIIEEVEGYSRKTGLYVVDPYCNLPDFERVKLSNIQVSQHCYFDEQGYIVMQGERVCRVGDSFYEQKVREKLKDVCFMDLYWSYQDQIYSFEGERLHFRKQEKYSFEIEKRNYEKLNYDLSRGIVSESKIKIPYNKKYKKPRERRRKRKQIKVMRRQMTNYMSLSEAINSISSLPISTLTQNQFRFPILLKDKEVVQLSVQIVEVLKECLIDGDWSEDKVKEMQQRLGQGYRVRWIYIERDLLCAYMSLQKRRNTKYSVVIQPQSKTQDILPYVFHLHCMSEMRKKKRGRAVKDRQDSNLFKMVKLHPTINEVQGMIDVNKMIRGVMKLNNEQQYGYGFQGLRMWICRNDGYLGDRQLLQKQISDEIRIGSFIRKIYWQLVPLLREVDECRYEQLSYLDRFMMDHIDYYIMNMEQAYSKLQLQKAYELTINFYKHYINEIYVKTIRHKIITYPKLKSNDQHIYVLHRIVSLLAVITPIFPFSTFHITKIKYLKWPKVQKPRVQLIPSYNRMTKLRVQVRNKITLNNFSHAQLEMPEDELVNLSEEDLRWFFNVNKIVRRPEEKKKGFSLRLNKSHPVGSVQKLLFYEDKEVCIRCSPRKYVNEHICGSCLEYMGSNLMIQGDRM